MKKNMSIVDRQIRIFIACIIAILFFTGLISGTLALVLLIIAGVLLLSSLFGICPLYAITGINTSDRAPLE
jgi:hypothetical protein